jgi:uncharacterized protein YndB with AHSA1/START domain
MRIISKEIVIDAPVAKVWKHITDPAKIAEWLMPNDFAPVEGRPFSMSCDEQGSFSCVVKEVVPEKKLVYTLTSPSIKAETTVAITLAAEKRGTRVKLVHSGWDALPPSDQGIADAFDQGWESKLKTLQEQVVADTH